LGCNQRCIWHGVTGTRDLHIFIIIIYHFLPMKRIGTDGGRFRFSIVTAAADRKRPAPDSHCQVERAVDTLLAVTRLELE